TISKGQALARHSASSPLFLSFNRGDVIQIKSKSAGSRPDLWGGEVNGRRGYFPKSYVREFGTVQAEPVYELPTEESEWAKKTPSQHPPPVQQPPQADQEHGSQEKKDGNEVDETDPTDLGDDDGEPAVKSDNEGGGSPASTSNSEAGKTEEAETDETELEDGDPAFNEFLASKFASESSQFASAPENEAAELGEEEQSEGQGLEVDDETELDVEDEDFLFPDKELGIGNIVKDEDLGQTQEEAREQKGNVVEQPQEDRKLEEEEKKDDVKQAEEEKKDDVKQAEEEKKDDVKQTEEEKEDDVKQATEEKEDDVKQAEEEKENDVKQAEEKEEKKDESPYINDETELSEDSSDAQDQEDASELPSKSEETAGEQFTVGEGQAVGETAQDQAQAPDEEKGPIEGVRVITANIPNKETPSPSTDDESVSSEGAPSTEQVEPVLGGDNLAETSRDETEEEEVNRELHFRSEMSVDGEEPPQQEGENTVDPTLQTLIHKDRKVDVNNMNEEDNGKAPSIPETRDESDEGGEDTGASDALAEKEEGKKVEPVKMVPPPPLQSDTKSHQPVDIDIIQPSGVHVHDGGLTLESSQTDPQQQWQAGTPVLQGTPSLEQGGQQSDISDQGVPLKPGAAQTEKPEDKNETPTSVIDGTTFYVVDGEIADIVPESASEGRQSVPVPREPLMSPPPPQATRVDNIQPTAVPPIPEIEHYQTNADFVSRKVLSLGQPPSQIPSPSSPASEPAVPAEQKTQKPGFQESPVTSDTVMTSASAASDIQPSVTAESSTASVTIEGEEQREEEDSQSQDTQDEQTTEDGGTAKDDVVKPPLAFDVPPAEKMVNKGDGEAEKSPEQTADTATQPPDTRAWDSIPPPPTNDDFTPPPDEWTPNEEEQNNDEPTLESDPYQMDDYYSRKINDEEVSKAEEEAAAYESRSATVMGSLEAHTKTFIDKLPPSLQSLLEQEPLGLSPAMTVLVTMTTLAMFLTITCFSCLCAGGKKSGKKDPLVVVRELEERLLMAVKEKENLEDLLQERQSENLTSEDVGSRLKEELSGLHNSSSSVKTDLQNVTTEVVELQEQLSRKSDDVKVKDKKTKDIEKETKKLNDTKAKLEKELQKKNGEYRVLEDENENLKSAIQSLTDQVQLLDTSKQQFCLFPVVSELNNAMLLEVENCMSPDSRVDELKERLDQLEQECKQAQETISFKDNELEVMKDCYMQLKAFEKEGGQGDDEEYDEGDSKDVQEKIQSMMDVSKVNATLRAVQEEKDSLENKLKIENDARRELEEQLECVRREMESSMADKMKAERQCQEAQTKLQVLSSYFKEKELQLQRELGEQEALKKQNLYKLDNADENTRTMAKELELSKSQIAANEKKAHENWLNARAAERELKEARHEAAVLRQKLTDVERRQMGPGGLIRPLPTRGMPPPALPPGPPLPPFRDDDFPLSPRERQRLPPSHPALHMPLPEARSPPPRMPPPDSRGSPPRLPPPDARSPPPRVPPPYDRRGPPHPMDSRSPPMRLPPPDMIPPLRGPLPPHMGPPPMGSPVPRDSPRDGYSARDQRPGQSPRDPYGRQPPPSGESRRHQSQV
ncbi:hypothetical protein BaRGS_00001952, partial [Batillaria attramentaria]